MLQLFKKDWREVWEGVKVPESGSVYTKPEIVDLMLDLAGYDPNTKRLTDCRLLEPSCGTGSFVAAIVERIIRSEFKYTDKKVNWGKSSLNDALLAIDISEESINATRKLIKDILLKHACPEHRSKELAMAWTLHGDFLLHDWQSDHFDFIIGNPPYVRMEEIPSQVLRQYRESFHTATDRTDLYIPFFECGLSLLGSEGTLAFICANRFAKNHYGMALRKFISEHYRVRDYINLEHTQPFLSDVSAYPAIVVIDRTKGAPTHAITVSELDSETLNNIRRASCNATGTSLFHKWYSGGAPWVSTCARKQLSLQELGKNFPTIESSAPGTRIGIGVATGADSVFVLTSKHEDIESSRQLPLLLTQDISCAKIDWSGHWLLNPFSDTDDGTLSELTEYPDLCKYLTRHETVLRARHCAKNRPHAWYKTIDRIWLNLVKTPKLVIPDIQSGGVVGYDPGGYYPHHNVYWITSDTWDLRALQAILRSSCVTEQLRAHSVEMRGGSIRYQAQNLRKIRIPEFSTINDSLLHELSEFAIDNDLIRINAAVERVFRIGRASAVGNR